MTLTLTAPEPGPDDLFLTETGDWLIRQRRFLDSTEGTWLGVLAEFNAALGYELDGQLSAASWLVAKCGMARSTAHEKVQVASELRRRPWLAEALASGTISYSAARTICRINAVDRELDAALIRLAGEGTVDDLERVVRHWHLNRDQDTPPPPERVGYRMSHGHHGLGKAVIEAPNDVLDELEAGIACFMATSDPDPDSDEDQALPKPTFAARRLDALLDMVRVAVAHPDAKHAMGADLYMVHVVTDLTRLEGGPGRATLADGTPIDGATLARIACDSSIVAHLTRDGIEPLALGRKTREWSTAQRRAILVRDGGRCRMPGCNSTHCDIHHLLPWNAGGPTDVASAALECRRHHVATHRGDLVVEGDANGTLTFRRADGTLIGSTRPLGDPSRLF